MHDFLLAKEIINKTLAIIQGRNLKDVKSVSLEIGSVSLAHDGHPEHAEDISLENLQFGIENIAKNTILKNTKFDIKKVAGESWKITDIELE